MKILVVGGNWEKSSVPTKRASKIISNLALLLHADCRNGGTLSDLEALAKGDKIREYDLIVWAPNISNEEDKFYPRKRKGATLIVTKRMRPHTTEIEALSRIFKFGGNAIITIQTIAVRPIKFKFKLIDALGNVWAENMDISMLIAKIIELYHWTSNSTRVGTRPTPGLGSLSEIEKLLEINKMVADKCQKSFGERFFGNLSTRCAKLFPSTKIEKDLIIVSARNTNKEELTLTDLILTHTHNGVVYFGGTRKPSVDTPVQAKLYKVLPNIKYMIHGHAYIKDAPCTKHYYPCGDLREVDGIMDVALRTVSIGDTPRHFTVNLKNHGFLIASATLANLEFIVDKSEYIAKGIEWKRYV